MRRIAADLALPTADKPESQEICFVPAGDYRALLAERRGYVGEPGPIVDADGTQLGTHTGYAHYTVGQRHGLGVALGEPVFVREVRPASNTVVVGRRDEIAASAVLASTDAASWPASRPAERFAGIGPDPASRRRSRVRGHAVVGDDRFAVEAAEPVWAPAPGQAAVLYDGDECLGGGRIARGA